MPTTAYYLQRLPVPTGPNRADSFWEEVDEYVFKNWKFAVDERDQSRYTGNRFTVEESKIEIIQEAGLKGRDLIHIAKLSGADHHDIQSQIPGGFCKKPEFVKVVKGNGTCIRQVGQRTFRAKPTDSPTPVAAAVAPTSRLTPAPFPPRDGE